MSSIDSSTVAAITAIVSALVGYRNYLLSKHLNEVTMRQREYELIQKAHEEERKEIYRKLNSFYGPLSHLLTTNGILYRQFKRNKPEEYSLLISLLNKETFVGNDEALVKEIFKVNAKVQELVLSQSGLVDSPVLSEMLARATAHYSLIQLAQNGDLQGDTQNYLQHMYPYELIDLVQEEAKKLKARLKTLNEGKVSDILGEKENSSALPLLGSNKE